MSEQTDRPIGARDRLARRYRIKNKLTSRTLPSEKRGKGPYLEFYSRASAVEWRTRQLRPEDFEIVEVADDPS